jgi:hypothetical protein
MAHSQDAPAAPPQEQSAQPEQQKPTGNAATAKGNPVDQGKAVTREATYVGFIEQVGKGDEWRHKKAMEEGREPVPDLADRREDLGIGDDDYQALSIIIGDAYLRIKALNDEFESATEELSMKRRNAVPGAEEKWLAMRDTYFQNLMAVVHEVRATLKQVMTEEGFRRTDAYIYRKYDGGKTYRSIPAPAKHVHSGGTPVPEQSQGAQP